MISFRHAFVVGVIMFCVLSSFDAEKIHLKLHAICAFKFHLPSLSSQTMMNRTRLDGIRRRVVKMTQWK